MRYAVTCRKNHNARAPTILIGLEIAVLAKRRAVADKIIHSYTLSYMCAPDIVERPSKLVLSSIASVCTSWFPPAVQSGTARPGLSPDCEACNKFDQTLNFKLEMIGTRSRRRGGEETGRDQGDEASEERD